MNNIQTLTALGLFSFTSLEGLGLAVIKSDGFDISDFGLSYIIPYDDELLEQIRSIHELKPDTIENTAKIFAVEEAFTRFCAEAVKDFCQNNKTMIDVIGFAGHTIFHDPKNHYTHQIGDGKLLSQLTGIKIVSKFRRSDILAGGQGAPFTPIYYQALTAKMSKPLAVVDVGGTSDIAWFGQNGEMIAFICGPGNAIINDWVRKKGGLHMDYNGKLAITGKVDNRILSSLMHHKYLALYPPKACDRNFFNDKMQHLDGLSIEDGAATATAFVAEAIAYSLALYIPQPAIEVIICGGGANNPTLVRFLRQRLPDLELKTAADVGWDNHAIDAQAAAFLAIRRLNFLPISFPGTTGVFEPLIGGEIS